MRAARSLVDKLSAEVDALHNRERNEESNNKEKMRANANTSRDLLFAAHLAEVLKVEILNEYHAFKGQDAPRITP